MRNAHLASEIQVFDNGDVVIFLDADGDIVAESDLDTLVEDGCDVDTTVIIIGDEEILSSEDVVGCLAAHISEKCFEQ